MLGTLVGEPALPRFAKLTAVDIHELLRSLTRRTTMGHH